MPDVINLRRARKQKARTESEAKAAANRIAHGRAKAEKTLSKAEAALTDKRLDGHKRPSDAD